MRLAAFILCLVILSAFQPVSAQPARSDALNDYFFPSELLVRHSAELGITDTQKQAIESTVREHRKQFVELQQNLQRQMTAMAEILRQEHPEESDALAQLDKLLAAERDIKRMQLSLALAIRSQLTPDQFAKAKELRQKYPAEARPSQGLEGFRARMQRFQERIKTLQEQGQDVSKETQALQQIRQLLQDGKPFDADAVLRRALDAGQSTDKK